MNNNTYQLKLDKTYEDIKAMSIEDIIKEFHILGCALTLEEIQTKLMHTYNELQVADEIFNNFTIDDVNSKYAKEFIDLGLLRIIELAPIYPFQHYGIFTESIHDIAAMEATPKQKVERLEESFAKFFKMAKVFKLDNFDGMMYQINDGMDLQAVIIAYLDDLMELGRMEPSYLKKIIAFIDRFNKEFKQVNPYLLLSLQYEYAQTFIALGNKQGEKLFLKLLEEQSDKTDVILHYALSYLDADEQRALKIVERNAHLLNKESDAYELVMEMVEDVKKGENKKV